jgi:transcriptional regulator with XRE-family HTH domain
MSPFALYLRELRRRRSLKQKEVADLLGYEQTYISALERSIKGPPRRDFLTRLVRGLRLSDYERKELNEALCLSKRRVSLPCEASIHEYELIRALEPQLGQLNSTQIALIKIALSPPVTTTRATPAADLASATDCAERGETMT